MLGPGQNCWTKYGHTVIRRLPRAPPATVPASPAGAVLPAVSRINDEHRLIHKAEDDSVLIAQCRDHCES